jgi:hypothetical protein
MVWKVVLASSWMTDATEVCAEDGTAGGAGSTGIGCHGADSVLEIQRMEFCGAELTCAGRIDAVRRRQARRAGQRDFGI